MITLYISLSMSLVTSNSTSLQTRAFIFKSVFTVFLYLPESFENPLDALAKTEVNQACQEPSPWHLPRTLLLTLWSVATETVTVRLLQGSQPGILSSGASHPAPPGPPAQTRPASSNAKLEKLPRPTFSLLMTEAQWEFIMLKWTAYIS